mgnify:CR=1 FL=1
MSLRYRYDKEGNVTGMGWGKGKNYEAGQNKLKTDAEKEKKRKKNVKTTKINKEIDRIKSGGKTYFKSKEDSLKSLKNKLKVAGGSSTKKGSTRAKMEAKNRSIHGDKKIDALKEKNRKFKENRANMAKLRKTDPEEYRKLKKAQRRAANAKALKSNSSTWD